MLNCYSVQHCTFKLIALDNLCNLEPRVTRSGANDFLHTYS